MNSSSSLCLQGFGEKCNFFFISFEPFPLEEIYYVSPIDDNLNLKSLSSNIFLGKKLILESMSSIEFCPVNPLLQLFCYVFGSVSILWIFNGSVFVFWMIKSTASTADAASARSPQHSTIPLQRKAHNK